MRHGGRSPTRPRRQTSRGLRWGAAPTVVAVAALGAVLAAALAVTSATLWDADSATRAERVGPHDPAPRDVAAIDATTAPTGPAVPRGPDGQDDDALEPTAGVPALAPSSPVRLLVPSIGIDTSLMELGLHPDGSLEVPPDAFPAGWYSGAPTPGAPGPAIVVGHVDWGGRPGVFADLHRLGPGADVMVTREDGTTARFRVTYVASFSKDEFPTGAVYGDLDHAGLRLITCGGRFDRTTGSYEDNLIIFAELVGSDDGPAS